MSYLGAVSRYKHHDHAAIFVSRSTQVDAAATGPAERLTFLPQSALVTCAEMAFGAFQRYAGVRMKKGLRPKRSECFEALQISPRLLGLHDIAKTRGKFLSENEVIGALSRKPKGSSR